MYRECYGTLQCALLLLPLDWSNAESGFEITLAVVKRPAKVSVTDPRYGGALIVNPGKAFQGYIGHDSC